MEQTSMTARISAFARAYHCEHSTTPVFDDSLAKRLLTEAEYQQIANHMSAGISYFSPTFSGTQSEALRWIVDHCLAPSPLGRAAYTEAALQTAVRLGARQYLIFAAGYDTFPYRQPDWAKDLQVFELDTPAMSAEKQHRLHAADLEIPENVHFIRADLTDRVWQRNLLEHPAFDPAKISVCSLLGLTYYLPKPAWRDLLSAIADMVPHGSSLLFDYPEATDAAMPSNSGMRQQAQLANGAGEPMCAAYSYQEMEALLAACGFLVYEHLTPPEITTQYFSAYNLEHPAQPITAMDHVNYCLAVRN